MSNQKSKTAQNIKSACIEVVGQYGWSAATTRQIAKTAGVSEVTLFRYYSSKYELLAAVLTEITQPLTEYQPLQSEDVTEDLIEIVTMYTDFITAHPGFITRILSEVGHPDIGPIVRPLQRSFLRNIKPVIAYHQARKSLANYSSEAIIISLIGPILAQALLGPILSNTCIPRDYVQRFLNGYKV